ncbi:unnamed protein product [Parascedosporium putredinis]|uniref:Uncharacterized protein n=1 Tax=Parascedosporium putredinis TaxID=1442378 RepID=A0A9P1GUW3_9PEZI|nr:unnamed protein product [Parascedosporium putredinis]CAI7988084.1 unnamed protein product [Parascedosporium putredinis]
MIRARPKICETLKKAATIAQWAQLNVGVVKCMSYVVSNHSQDFIPGNGGRAAREGADSFNAADGKRGAGSSGRGRCAGPSRGGVDVKARTKQVLEMVSVVRVFDVKGVWEVLDDLECEADGSSPGSPSSETSGAEIRQVVGAVPKVVRDEIPDSDEEASPSASPPNLATPPPPPPPPIEGVPATAGPRKEDRSGLSRPDIVLITHFSTLLTTLFTHAEKNQAHTALQLLSSRLRFLAHCGPSSPLILITNSLATPGSASRADPVSARGPGVTPVDGPDLEIHL